MIGKHGSLVDAKARCLAAAGTAFGVLTAGCSGDSGKSTRTETTTTRTTDTTVPGVSATVAKKRALAAEEQYLRNRLENASCLEEWGVTPTTVSEQASVVDRTADGVVVEVVHPYWFSNDGSHADLGSRARCLVTERSARRIDGETVSPC